MLAVWAVLTAATAAAKDAEEAPAGTTTDAGTDTAPLLLLNATVTPPSGAAAFRLTEHPSVLEPVTIESLQVNPASAGATPSPLILIVAAPTGELLEIVTTPVNELTWSA
jgi:hypothetical protein